MNWLFPDFSPPVRATVTCSCGARIVVRSHTHTEADQQVRNFLIAHEPCQDKATATGKDVAAAAEREATPRRPPLWEQEIHFRGKA